MGEPRIDIEKFRSAVFDLRDYAEKTFGVFHDAVSSMGMFALRLNEQVQAEKKGGMDLEDARNLKFIYAKGDPVTGTPLHRSTIGEIIDRCTADGPNESFLGAMCLVSIYALWEDHVRGNIAVALNIPKNNVTHDVLGEVRIYRRLILHANATADNTVLKCKILTWAKPNEKIVVERERLRELVQHLREFPLGLVTHGFNLRTYSPHPI